MPDDEFASSLEEHPPRDTEGQATAVMRAGMINTVASVIIGIISLLLVPLVLHQLGADGYGLVLSAAALAGMIAPIDFGIAWKVTRRLAGEAAHLSQESATFVRMARTMNLVVACAGGLAVLLIGRFAGQNLELSAANAAVAPRIFALTALAFVGDRILAVELAVLVGLERFDRTSQLNLAAAVVRATGTLVIILNTRNVQAYALWQACASLVNALIFTAVAAREVGTAARGFASIHSLAARAILSTGVAASVAYSLDAMYVQLPQLALGALGGASWVAVFYTAQRLPLSVMTLLSGAAIAVMPAAARFQGTNDVARLRALLGDGTRWVLLLVLPVFVILWIIAPTFLSLWLGGATPERVAIMRLTTAAVFVDCFALAALQLLWGCGRVKDLLAFYVLISVVLLGAGWLLIERLAVVGMAWAALIAVTAGSALVIQRACRICAERPQVLFVNSLRGLAMPIALTAAVTLLAARALGGTGWIGLLFTGALGAAAYTTAVFLRGGREEERAALRRLTRMLVPRGVTG